MAASNNSFTTAGANNWTCPLHVVTANIEIWAAGGSGGGGNATLGAGGGGGGAYARVNNYAVTAGTIYALTVGNGGAVVAANTNGNPGENSVFKHNNGANLAWTEGGRGGVRGRNSGNSAGGATANSSGNNTFAGGNGSSRNGTTTTQPGSGGGAGGSTAGGTAGANTLNAAGGAGGNVGGGNGGNSVQSNNGLGGNQPGGGGAGGGGGNKIGGAGGVGKILITFDDAIPIIMSNSANIAAGGNDVTTNLLTAPSGKNNTSFQAGKISDDTNPLPTINLGANNWTEIEFCIKAQSAKCANNDVWQLRLSANGTEFNNYTIAQANWTIGDYTSANNGGTIIPLLMRSYRARRI
jgi:hypothetical protein